MAKKIDLTGKKFHKLTVICDSGIRTKHRQRLWECLCDCGKVILLSTGHLGGTQKSCGCLKKMKEKIKSENSFRNNNTYNTWSSMRDRCNNKNNKNYHNYGGRGIKVCKRWDSFTDFHKDMGGKPKSTSLERIDNNKGYSPTNCKWATRKEQARNTRKNVFWTDEGITLTVAEWSEKTNISYQTLYNRVNYRGWTIKKALTTAPLSKTSYK